MRSFTGYLFSLLLGVTVSLPSVAEVNILALDIPGLHDSRGEGVYDQVINKILVSKGKAKITLMPPARAIADFESCNNCCISPANKNPEFYSYGDDTLQSEPMNTAKIYIFTAKGSQALTSVNQLKGKTVGIRDGMPYGNTFESADLDTSSVSEIEKNIKKLAGGRIDAFVAYIPDAYIAYNGMSKNVDVHDKSSPIAVHEDSIVCRGVDKGLLDTFKQEVQAMRNSGELKQILGEGFVE